MPNVRLKIRGMTCAACVRRVERSLQKLPGVQTVSVNLATERAELECDAPLPPDALIEAVRRIGYEAELDAPETMSAPSEQGINWRLWLSVALSLPIFLLSMVFPDLLPAQGWVLLALTTPIQFGTALPLYKSAYGALRGGSANMEVLVLMGTLAAYFYSLALTLAGQHHHLYYETSAIILTLVLLGRHMESRARRQARRAMEALWSLLPNEVLRWNGNEYERVPIQSVQAGDRLRVRTGERVPVDGIVLEGSGWVDESALTGESVPAERHTGQRVLGGSLLVDGVLDLRAEAVGQTTLLAQIAQAVERAQSQKAPVQRLADRIASIFVPVVVLIALGTLGFWWLKTGSFGTALVPAVSVLVIACPCALGLAVPIALMTGTTRAMRAGVLIRNITVLERVRHVNTLVLDKTGTLTLGYPQVQRVVVEGIDERTALAYAFALESTTSHPLAEAIVNYAQERLGNLSASREADEVYLSPLQVRTVPGGGVIGQIDGHLVMIGSARFLQEQGVSVEKNRTEPVLLAVDGRVVASFSFVDQPLPELHTVLDALRREGITIILCSGDQPEKVAEFARSVGIERWYAGQLPQQKALLVAELQKEGRKVAFVGDGVNDAPALAQADLSVAVAEGTHLATETADLVLLNRDLRTLITALHLSRAIHTVIRQNLFFAFVYNTLGIPLASMGYLNPMVAALAMSLSSLS
ncbi:MAG: cation-translocating P-type ATPase, partial [Fimbriimonadales bacterium]